MKFKLILIFLLITVTVFSQKNKTKFRKYRLINKYNDTVVYGKKLSIEKLQKGFRIFDENGKKTKHKITPDMQFKYLSFIENNDTIILKSLKSIVHPTFYPYKNAFMSILIDNPNVELKKGKINFYVHSYNMHSQMMGSYTVSIIYFQDIKGMHRINHKYQYKKYPKILGKEKYKEMKKSKKGELGFLIDYFTEYNSIIDKKENYGISDGNKN